MHGQYIRSIDRQLIIQEDNIPVGSRGLLKAETESEMIAAQDQALQTKCHATKVLKTVTANADCVNNMMRQWTTLYQHAQYWQQNNTYSDMMECVLNYTLTYAMKRG
jgi:hypothetical protein